MVKVLGVDCSLNNLGLSVNEVDEDTFEMKPLFTELFCNDTWYKKNMKKSFIDFDKARNFYDKIKTVAEQNNVSFIVAEIPCGSQSSRACTSAGIVTGILGSLARDFYFVGVTPIDAKKASVGTNTATKEEVISWVHTTFPELPVPTIKSKGVTRIVKKFEHEADSIAIAYAGIQTSEFLNFFNEWKEKQNKN